MPCFTAAVSLAALVALAEPGTDLTPRPGGPPARAARTLQVTGEGRAMVAPDLATVTFAAVAVDPSLVKATRDANDRARRLLDAVAAGGIPAADVQTSRYEVQIERSAERPQDPPRIRGYRVTNAVVVKVRELSRLGALLDRAVAAGANEVGGPAFSRADPAPEEARALAAAVRAGRAKAEEMARAAGVRLGALLELREGGRGRPGPLMTARALSAGAETPVAPGQIAFENQVEMVFALE
jgi:uncharacterized protein YggE